MELSIGQCATLACLFDVTAPKPGNVHRSADFEDVGFADFIVSAVAIGPSMENASRRRVGETVLDSVRATRAAVASNTNLGMILLLAPLCAVPRNVSLQHGVAAVLESLTPLDSRDVYAAIREAQPGGLGTVTEMDVAQSAPTELISAMRAAQDRDLIAQQYVNGFRHVLEYVVPWLREGSAAGWELTQTIIRTHVRFMAQFPDTLIARKCGIDVARQASWMAGEAIAAGEPNSEEYEQALSDLDFWLRSDGHRRNPGTTADLITAGLFAAFRDGLHAPPWR